MITISLHAAPPASAPAAARCSSYRDLATSDATFLASVLGNLSLIGAKDRVAVVAGAIREADWRRLYLMAGAMSEEAGRPAVVDQGALEEAIIIEPAPTSRGFSRDRPSRWRCARRTTRRNSGKIKMVNLR